MLASVSVEIMIKIPAKLQFHYFFKELNFSRSLDNVDFIADYRYHRIM